MANAVNLPGNRLAGLNIDLMQKLKTGVRTLDELALFLQGKNPFGNTLFVPPSLTILERIALGAYDWKNHPDITNELFPHDPMTVGEWKHDLYLPNCHISSDIAMKGAEVDGWAAAKAEHLLAYGEQFPDEQLEFTIIALGSKCKVRGDYYVLGLRRRGVARDLALYYWSDDLSSHYRFLRVRKVLTA